MASSEGEQPLAPSTDLVSRNRVLLVDIELDPELVYLLLTATSPQALDILCPTFLNDYLGLRLLGLPGHFELVSQLIGF